MSPTLKELQNLRLQRYPQTKDPNLRAWNAADEYIIQYLAENIENFHEQRFLVVNDQFGAISVALNEFSSEYMTDSYLSGLAIEKNLKINWPDNVKATAFSDGCFDSRVLKEAAAEKYFSVVIIRVPKHLSLLEYQLRIISHHIDKNTMVIGAGMTKEIHKSTLSLFERLIGPTRTSLAHKKARLILSNPEIAPAPMSSFSSYMVANPVLPDKKLTIFGYPGVFSREKLDLGTRVLFDHIPPLTDEKVIADLGCGAGVIGAVIAQAYPTMRVILSDESAMAIASARKTFIENNLTNGSFYQTDCLENTGTETIDLVLCNPPFHQQNVQTLSIAKKMMHQSSNRLSSNGSLYLVANRHLKYSGVLKTCFKDVSIVSDDPKFIVWRGRSPRK
ncbi:methyltransferase [Aliikangiella sp. G2MR2-5]|uniref:methyltransferase n=1 Tax=Aliikangiella sp. G2MR2-5 TaxID=2788943 RepID=UPI0018A895C1|nr:methyltransferase [Aliikangiella sp. G2MR2-5]